MTETLTYDQAYEQYYEHLVRYVHQITYDWSVSEDIAQDTMLNITPTDSKTRANRGRILMRKMVAA